MALPFYNWSRTAASNATADSTVNWAENQAPSSVNDSARAMMASTAAFRDDISGAITTGGTSTAYTVTSYQVFSSLATMANQMIAFTPHATNTAACTLNVDGLGAKSIRSSPNVELPSGTLILGTPYVVTYNNSDSCFYLQGGASNPYSIPLGSGIDYWGATAPNSAFAFAYGQAISRTTYSTLFSLFSTTFGTGDGSTTFNIPDLRGRIPVYKDDMGGSAASRVTTASGGVDGATLGASGGASTRTIAQANLPNVNLVASSLTATTTVTNTDVLRSTLGSAVGVTSGGGTNVLRPSDVSSGSLTAVTTLGGNVPLGGSGTALATMPPAIVCNYILRII